MITGHELDARSLTDVEGIIISIMNFEFLTLLYLWFDMLTITKTATKKVQGSMLNVGVSCNLIKSCVQQFSSMRACDKHFEDIIKKAETVVLLARLEHNLQRRDLKTKMVS